MDKGASLVSKSLPIKIFNSIIRLLSIEKEIENVSRHKISE